MWRQEDDLQSMLRESVDRFAAGRDTMARFRSNRESSEGFDPDTWRAMADAGWTAVLLPQRFGGMGLDILPALSLAEAVGRNLIAEPFVASAVIAATVLGVSDASRAQGLARDLVAGEAVVVLADQEEVGAIGAAPPGTALTRRRGNGYELAGHKVFVPAWTGATELLVSATFEGTPVILAVDPKQPGIIVETQRMTDGAVCADVAFDCVVLDNDAILLEGSAAASATRLALARGTLAIAAQLEGAARSLLSQTSDYLGQRVQFGAPLANFQSIRHGMATQHLNIELAGASWRSAALALQDGLTTAVLAKISMAKARCSDVALGMGEAAVHYHGAFGFTEEANVGLYLNAVLRWASWMGSAPAHRIHALKLSKDQHQDHG